ncbi:MAG: ChbG/HpnK family deacetylase [Thermoanaerobaculia bacterium]
MKLLLVNADDFGRTPGVNAGVLEAHLRGVVTSATVMVLEPFAEEGIREALSRASGLDLGLHVVLTGGGRPASGSLPTLAPEGRLARNAEALPPRLDREEVAREIEAQIARFVALASRLPSHLDSHHHCALHPDVEPVYAAVARGKNLPLRAASAAAQNRLRRAGLRTPDTFLDSFFGEGATAGNLRAILGSLPEGTSELMCHPGYPDEALLSGSSYAREREREVEVLCDPELRPLLRRLGIELAGFSRL